MCGKWKITEKKRGVFIGKKHFQTGSFSFRLRFPEELVLPADMEKFAVEKGVDRLYLYHYYLSIYFRRRRVSYFVNRVDLQVFRNGEGLESRLDRCERRRASYALYRETAQSMHRCLSGDGIWMELQNMRLYFCLFLHWNAACRSGHA